MPSLLANQLEQTHSAECVKEIDMQRLQNHMRVPEFYWFGPFNPQDWTGFHLKGGQYQPVQPNTQGQLLSPTLHLALVQWQGTFKQVETTWLRWAQLDGSLLLTAEEQAQQRAEQESLRATQAEAQIQQIARNLLQTEMPIDQIAATTGLSIELLQSLT